MTYKTKILIVGYNCPTEISKCVASLLKSNDTNFDILICENGGADAYRSLIAAVEPFIEGPFVDVALKADESVTSIKSGQIKSIIDSEITLHCAKDNLGFAAGVNVLLKSINDRDDWENVWVLNPDTTVDSQTLVELKKAAQDQSYGIIGSRIILPPQNIVHQYAGGYWVKLMANSRNIGFGSAFSAPVDRAQIERTMNYVCGASMFCNRNFVEKAGLMSEDYFLYVEEVDWCFKRGDLKLGYAHDAIVYHEQGATTGASFDMRKRSAMSCYLQARNAIVFTRRFFPHQLLVIAPVALAFIVLRYLKARAFTGLGYAVRGWWAGIKREVGVPAAFAKK